MIEPANSVQGSDLAVPAAASFSARRRSAAAACLFLAIASAMFWFGWKYGITAAEIPVINQPGMDRLVIDLLRDVRQRVEQRPYSAGAWGEFGMCLLQHDRPREALTCFLQAQQLDPGEPRWPWFAGSILEQTDLAAAQRQLERVFTLLPDAAHVRLRLASLRLAAGDAASVEQLLLPLAARPEAAGECAVQRLRAARLLGDTTAALEVLAAARTGNAISNRILEEAATAVLQAGRLDEARALRLEAAGAPPLIPVSDPWATGLLAFDVSGSVSSVQADQLRGQGRFSEAAARLAALARRFPDRSRPALNLALARREQGDLPGASADLHQLQGRFPNDPLVKFHLAVSEAQLGNTRAAMNWLQECLKQKPDYGIARAALADLMAADGRPEEGIVEAERAAADSPEDVWIRFGLIRLLLTAGRREPAARQLQVAAALPSAAGAAEQQELQRLQQMLAAIETGKTGAPE